ncbi:MAG: ATP-binding protein [Cytophagaceae bacterium]|jgi:nitrogen-specific signal transduction histidine kinase/CheY-like chemotaxis protein|nr:ATP-binding protein [Cytophagaceae bacterium]
MIPAADNASVDFKKEQYLLFVDITAITTMLFGVIYFSLEIYNLAILLSLTTLISSFNTWFYQYKSWSLGYSCHAYIAINTFIGLVPVAWLTGGLESLAMGWFLFPPIVMIMLFKEKNYMYIWFLIVVLILLFFSYLYWMDYPVPQIISSTSILHTVYFMSYVGLFFLVFTFSYLFLKSETKARVDLEYVQYLLKTTNREASIGTWEYNIEQDVFYLSDVAIELIGSEPTIKRFTGWIDVSSKESFYAAVKQCKHTAENFDKEFLEIKNGKESVWYRCIGLANNKNQQCVSVFGLMMDITDEKKRHQILQKSKRQAERINNSKTSFITKVSHELRTPLHTILGYSSLVDVAVLNEVQKKYAQYVRSAAASLNQLIGEVLDFAKIDTKNTVLNIRPIDIQRFLNEIMQLFSLDAKTHQLEIRYQLDEGVPEILYIDEIVFKQVLINLISNAIKFTERGSVVVQLHYLPAETPNVGILNVQVKDTGIGISHDNINKIFQAFERPHVTSYKRQGTGLGLTITNELLSSMGSKIEVASLVGLGTVFYFYLPVKVHFSKTTVHRMVEAPKKLLSNKKLTLVLVEDHSMNLRLLETLVNRMFPQSIVYGASDGNTALDLIKKELPDIILTDIHMPGLNGYDLAKCVRKESTLKDTIIIAVTAGLMGEQYLLCQEVGIQKLLPKPVLPEVLFEAIEHSC